MVAMAAWEMALSVCMKMPRETFGWEGSMVFGAGKVVLQNSSRCREGPNGIRGFVENAEVGS